MDQRREGAAVLGPARLGTPSSPGKAGRWARSPPLTGPRRPRRPLPPGPARRPGHDRVAPGGAEGRGAGPYQGSPRPSPVTTWRSQCKRFWMSQPNSGFWARPGHPPIRPPRPGPQSRAARAPTGTGPERRRSSRGSGIRARAPHSSTPCSPQTLLSGLPALPRTAPSPPAGVYRDSGRRRLSSPSTKMAAGPEPPPQRLERVGD